MNCEEVQRELFAFQFCTLEREARTALEEHLLGCRACLAEYLAIKREVETAELDAPASPGSRARLREAVAQELGLKPRERPSWWVKPFAAAFAAASVATAVLLVQVAASSAGQVPRALQSAKAGEAP